jgi:hypothetical protein
VTSVPTVQSTTSPLTAGDGRAFRSAPKRTRTPSGYTVGRRRHSLRVIHAGLCALHAEVGRGRITLLVLTTQPPPRAAQEVGGRGRRRGQRRVLKKLPVVRLRATRCRGAKAASQPVPCLDNGTLTETRRAER